MMTRWNGGIIGPENLPTADSASGIWGLPEQGLAVLDGVWPVMPFVDRGLFGGGSTTAAQNVIQYITISTTGNSVDFGDLTRSTTNLAGCSNGYRGVFGGGGNIIDYVAINTPANAVDFGDLIIAVNGLSACSNGQRGVFAGGRDPSSSQIINVIQYITISTTGNALDFGDLTTGAEQPASCAGGQRGVFGGRNFGGAQNTIDYITISTTGNATDFGDLTLARYGLASCSNGTRGVFGGGETQFSAPYVNVIDYITIATTGNATDFGDLTLARYSLASCSNGERGVFGGGLAGNGLSATNSNVIDYITISTIGNATDFGDLLAATSGLAALSGFTS